MAINGGKVKDFLMKLFKRVAKDVYEAETGGCKCKCDKNEREDKKKPETDS